MTRPAFLTADEHAERLALERHLDETHGRIGAEAADRLDYLRAKAEGYRFHATFTPIVPDAERPLVHVHGEATTWDCSEDVWRMDPDTREGIIEAMKHGKRRLDSDDVLKHGTTAPQVVRDWTGPFLVTVAAQPPTASVVDVRITGRWSTVVSIRVAAGVKDPAQWALEHADTSDVDFNEAEHDCENFEVVGTAQVQHGS